MMNASKDAYRVLKLELERTPEAPALGRAAIIGLTEDRAFSPGTIATLTLLVSEIVTNAVVHPQVDPPGRIGFYARLRQGRLRVEVSDPGDGFVPRPRDPSQPEGGYGLYLLQKEATSWGVERAPHTTVWFEVAAERA